VERRYGVGPKISVCRKGDNVYLKLMGDISPHSSEELLHAVKKMVLASLRFSSPGSKVSCTFTTQAKVSFRWGSATGSSC
jgi:hypothetical protein